MSIVIHTRYLCVYVYLVLYTYTSNNKYMQKTLYWDIETEAKVKKIKKAVKGANRSLIARKAIHMTEFDRMVEELNKELNNA